MSTMALIGGTLSGALTYVGCSVGAYLENATAIVAAASVATIVGAEIHQYNFKRKRSSRVAKTHIEP